MKLLPKPLAVLAVDIQLSSDLSDGSSSTGRYLDSLAALSTMGCGKIGLVLVPLELG